MMPIAFDPRVVFPDFYTNKTIEIFADEPRWTISGRLGDLEENRGKAPLDLRHLLATGRLRGAWARDDRCLVTLNELTRTVPEATNAAFYLEAITDGVLVIDIEPSCPPEIAMQLLALPGILYSEVSMSGEGYHLVTLLPRNFRDHKFAHAKKVLREAHGHFELLIEHWVTFTRRPIPDAMWAQVQKVTDPEPDFASVEALYASLAETATSTMSVSAVSTEVEAPDIAGAKQLVKATTRGARARFKSLSDFDGDCSRFEFSILGTLYNELNTLLTYEIARGARYTDSDRAWLLYIAASRVLPPRSKHRERRSGRPYLLDRAAAMVAAHKTTTTIDDQEVIA